MSECWQKVTCDFIEIVKNHEFKREAVPQILFYTFESIFDTMVLYSVGSHYCKRYDAKCFGQKF